MTLKDILFEDLKVAMKNNDNIAKNTIQLIRANIINTEKEKQEALTDREIEDIIIKEKKKRLEAQAQFEKAQRKDLMEKNLKEIAVLDKYLPQQMSEYELTIAMKEIIKQETITQKDLGKLIRITKEKYGNSVDGRMVANIAKQLLTEE